MKRVGRVELGSPARRVSALEEPIAGDFRQFLGGRMGRFARVGAQEYWTPVRIILALALLFLAFGYLSKANCLQSQGEPGAAHLDWSGNKQLISGCYSDIVPLYKGRGLDQDIFPYAFSWQDNGRTRYLEYPVGTGYFQWIMATLTRVLSPALAHFPVAIAPVVLYFAFTALVMSVLWVLATRYLLELTGNRVWDTILVVTSPIVIIHAFTNWDIPAIFCAVVALWLMSRGKPGWAGLALGVGTALKLWPVLLLGAYFVLAARGKTWRPWLTMAGTTLVSLVVLNLPIALRYPEAWQEFRNLNTRRPADWDSIYALLTRETPWRGFDIGAGTPTVLNTVSLVLFLAACVGVLILGLRAKQTPRVAQLCFLILAAFLFFNKVWSPQYSLWLLPFAVLALPRWRLIYTWGVVETLLWLMRSWFLLGADERGVPAQFFDLLVILRDGVVLTMVGFVVLEILGRHIDVVRRDHGGDPLVNRKVTQ